LSKKIDLFPFVDLPFQVSIKKFNIQMAVNLKSYVESVRATLKPPVSNKILFDGDQIKVMVVGGPNQRKDFHVEKGEELFYMLIGDMDLDIMENGMRKRIHISEGNFFLLPSCVPHSPQRYADTIGIVFERERSADELDCLRWYVPDDAIGGGGDEVLYEEVFNCTDLGTQLKEVIDRFNTMQSNNNITKPKTIDNDTINYFVRLDSTPSSDFHSCVLAEKVLSSSTNILETGDAPRAETLINSEFRVDLISNTMPVALNCETGGEVFLWQQQGSSEIYESELESESGIESTEKKSTIILQVGEVIHLKRRLLSNSTPILVSQLELGGSVICVTNSTIIAK
jgi:3-hydroxyanthranilate 3,4-dioxygenase